MANFQNTRSASAAHADKLTGVLERIIFLNEENHYTIAEFRPDSDGAKPAEKITIVGALPGAQCGETLHLAGQWTKHSQHGDQFKVESFKAELPSSVYGIRKYLGSGLVPGIGKVYANKIVDALGTDTFRVLSEESAKLRNIPGIGKVRAAAIKKAWDDQRALREIHIFLQTYGVTTSQCVKLIDRYGHEAMPILKNEPYRVAREIDGIGFKTADRIAINLGFANDAPPRLDAGILFAMDELQEEGHTALREADLIDYTAQLLETSPELLASRVAKLIETKQLVAHFQRPEYQRPESQRPEGRNPETVSTNPIDATLPESDSGPLASGTPASGILPLIQLPLLNRAEQKIAATIARLVRVPSGLPPIKDEIAVEWAEKKAGINFADKQRAAILAALRSKISILTGGPGTGKTSSLRALVEILKAKRVRVHLAAPTGRAAQRLAESTGGFASTIHRLLKYDPAKGGFSANEDTPLSTDFLIVDEASMLDTRLAASLFQAIPSRAHLLLVGDTDQLPSVGAGNVLKDIIATAAALPPPSQIPNSNTQIPKATAPDGASAFVDSSIENLKSKIQNPAIPVTRLDVIHRQKGQSQIVATAHAINNGDPSLPPSAHELSAIQAWGDLTFVIADSPDDCLRKTIALCTEFIPRHYDWFDRIRDVQVLAPMHKGVAGVGNLNTQLQTALNPRARGYQSLSGRYRTGDKVIQLRNNYDKNIFNGDIGAVTSADPETGALTIDFDGNIQTFEKNETGDLALAYAISIHKSQGSEYPVVIIPLLKGHFMMLQRNLLYTAITRGKKKVFIVGEPAAYGMAVRNNESKLRSTHLREKIIATLMQGL
ncbi:MULTISPECIES: AAA family ATPase [unclassified Ereboglobus]|uniref:AAA family ATPase n=1 Tax=unclassified Ereboglobus TaxID=2626932 RepID=UPI002405841B|nr:MULTISPECIES: AAA family ATPase [unclassified Ereboglobus]